MNMCGFKTTRGKRGCHPNMRKKFKGPFKIAKKLSEVLHEVVQCNGLIMPWYTTTGSNLTLGLFQSMRSLARDNRLSWALTHLCLVRHYYPPKKKQPILPSLSFRRRVGDIVRLWAPRHVNASVEWELDTVRTESSVEDRDSYHANGCEHWVALCTWRECVSFETGQAPESIAAEDHMGQGGRPQITIRRPVWQDGFVLNLVNAFWMCLVTVHFSEVILCVFIQFKKSLSLSHNVMQMSYCMWGCGRYAGGELLGRRFVRRVSVLFFQIKYNLIISWEISVYASQQTMCEFRWLYSLVTIVVIATPYRYLTDN